MILGKRSTIYLAFNSSFEGEYCGVGITNGFKVHFLCIAVIKTNETTSNSSDGNNPTISLEMEQTR